MHCTEVVGIKIVSTARTFNLKIVLLCIIPNQNAHRAKHSIASAPRPDSHALATERLAAAETSKGLPLPPAAPPLEDGGGVDDGSRLSSGREVAAGGLVIAEDGAPVVVARPLSVEVDIEPVTIPDGPTAMGTMTCSVWPLLSVVVLVNVERTMLVSCGASSPAEDVCAGFLLVGFGAGGGDGVSELVSSDAAA